MGFMEELANISSFGAMDTVGEADEFFGTITGVKRARLLQYLSLGGDLESLRIEKGMAKGIPKSERVRFGGSVFRVPTQGQLVDQNVVLQDKILAGRKNTREALQQIPEFQQLVAESEGRGTDFLEDAFRMLGQEVLGASAPKGLLFDQAPGLLAQTALGKAQFTKQVQDRARQSILGVLGFGQPLGVGTEPGGFNFGSALGFNTQQSMGLADILGLQAGIQSSAGAGLFGAAGTVGGAALGLTL